MSTKSFSKTKESLAAVRQKSCWNTGRPQGLNALESAWKHYIAAVKEKTSDAAKAALRSDIIGRAIGVANASGGMLGLGKVSSDEKQVIGELEQAIDG